MTAATLDLSDFIITKWYLILIVMFAPIIAALFYSRTDSGKLFFAKLMTKAPIIGGIVHKTNIEVFCRVFYTLYSGSADSIEPIRIAAEATDNAYFEKQIKEIAIPMMLEKGAGMSDSFAASKVFTDTAISRFRTSEEAGTIKNTALQLANYYESETTFKLKNVIEMIGVFVAMFILIVMVALTLVSAETATISPPNPMAR